MLDLITFIIELFVSFIEFCFEVGFAIYSFFIERNVDKLNLSESQKFIINLIGIVFTSILTIVIIFFAFYLYRKLGL